MPIIATEGTKREPIPEDTYLAVCHMVCDLGTQHDEYMGKPIARRQVLIGWQFPSLPKTEWEDENGTHQSTKYLTRFFTLSLDEKANLRKLCKGWRGRDFTAEEKKAFDVSKMLGAPAQVQIVHDVKENGDIRDKIENVIKFPNGMAAPAIDGDPISFDFDDHQQIPANVPEWVGKIIMKSDEWKALHGESTAQGQTQQQHVEAQVAAADKIEDEEDNLPF